MFIAGKHVTNITCPRCRYRHPGAMSCADAAAHAAADKPAPELRVQFDPDYEDLILIKEAVRYGQFSEDMLRQHGLSQPIREALFRIVKE